MTGDTVISEGLFHYWGKAGEGSERHPIVYHALDVAAVGLAFIREHHRLRALMARAAGTDEDTLVRWLVFFLLIHDIGKLSGVFQHLRPDLAPAGIQIPVERQPYYVRHDTLGYQLWSRRLGDRVRRAGILGHVIGEHPYWPDYFDHWARAVLCHHGLPPKEGRRPPRIPSYFSEANLIAAESLVDAVVGLLPPAPQVPCFAADLEHLCENGYPAILSWWLAGFAILCDWLGSNRDFFPYVPEAMPLGDYWERNARPSARRVLGATGILPAVPAPSRVPTELFKFLQTLTPLQAEVRELDLGDGPQLFILEDVTGSGKTEAAYLLINRLMAAGRAEGFYLALPTMATANGLYARTRPVYRRLFSPECRPSLVLAHGSARLDEGFTGSIVPVAPDGDLDYADEDRAATAHCNAWLADSRKKALLAAAGVGTLDQALLGVLQSRHQSLRLLGLVGKILVVDEVHAADAYMHRLLRILLELHATAGGSAILLSATLPRRMRQELADAFARGLGTPAPSLAKKDYPLLTQVGGQGHHEIAVPTRSEVARVLGFGLFASESQVLDWILGHARDGACVCWVRNSVADAMQGFDTLTDRWNAEGLPAGHLSLFHARFALADRMAIEEKTTATFGRESHTEQRRGRVLIATQVVEQSLDLDFDHLVSDLAPIDLLLQRAGRLRRHTRDAAGNLIDGADRRGAVRMWVLTPDPPETAGPDWLATLLPGTAAVYDEPWPTLAQCAPHRRPGHPRGSSRRSGLDRDGLPRRRRRPAAWPVRQ